MSDDPYRCAAPHYLALCWQPLWLPPGRKFPPPRGYTGYNARAVTAGRVRFWSSSPGNIALHMPAGVVAIDIDAYHGGLATLEALVAVYGPLSLTWSSTSRTDGSRCLLYRCTTDLPGVLGQGIEVVQSFHRYLVVAPSLHPEGRLYRWWDPDGEAVEYPPRPEDLPALTEAWSNARPLGHEHEPPVRKRRVVVAPAAIDAEVEAFIEQHHANRWPEAWEWVAESLDRDGCRHDRLVAGAAMCARDAVHGRYPARVGFDRLRKWWRDVMDDDDRRDGREFFDAVAWAVAQAPNDDDEDEVTWNGEPIPTLAGRRPPLPQPHPRPRRRGGRTRR